MSTAVDVGELQSAYDALVEAAVAQSVEGYAGQFVEDCVLLTPHAPPIRGQSALKAWLKSFFSSWSLEVDTLEFQGTTTGDRVAYAWYIAKGTYVSSDGQRHPFDHKYLDVFEREPGGPWRFAAHMANVAGDSAGIWGFWKP